MKIPRSNYFLLPLFFVSLLSIYSCAKPILAEKLIPYNLGNEYLIYSGPLYKSIVVDAVGGGQKTEPGMFSEIGNPELKEAIIRSLAQYNYLAFENKDGDYTLNVFLVEVGSGGIYTITKTTFVKYKIINNKDNKVFYAEIIDASDTKTISDVYYGNTRGRIAKENSMKKNIAKFIEKLFLLNGEQ